MVWDSGYDDVAKGNVAEGIYQLVVDMLGADGQATVESSTITVINGSTIGLTVDCGIRANVDADLPIFSPNNDGKFDTANFNYNLYFSRLLSGTAAVKITVSDSQSRKVFSVDQEKLPGDHTEPWDGKANTGTVYPVGAAVASGIYTVSIAVVDPDGASFSGQALVAVDIDKPVTDISDTPGLIANPSPFTPNKDLQEDNTAFWPHDAMSVAYVTIKVYPYANQDSQYSETTRLKTLFVQDEFKGRGINSSGWD